MDNSKATHRHASGRSKQDVYDWKEIQRYESMDIEVDKHQLRIDERYQRIGGVNLSRVLDIAKNYDEAMLGVILAAVRSDGTYWIVDGQHRWLAAMRREDVSTLPCKVFKSDGPMTEAKIFERMNGNRGPVKAIDRHRAQAMAGDEVAIEINRLAYKHKYSFDRRPPKGMTRLKCVGAVRKRYEKNRDYCVTAFEVCSQMAGGEEFNMHLFNGLFRLEEHLQSHGQSIADRNNIEKLLAISPWQVDKKYQYIRSEEGSGEKSAAKALVSLLNHRRRTKKIPGIG